VEELAILKYLQSWKVEPSQGKGGITRQEREVGRLLDCKVEGNDAVKGASCRRAESQWVMSSSYKKFRFKYHRLQRLSIHQIYKHINILMSHTPTKSPSDLSEEEQVQEQVKEQVEEQVVDSEKNN
jgi:hypothetical protein